MRVLVLDDNDETRDTIAHVLRYAGHEVLEAATGAQALDVLERSEVDVAVLDKYLDRPGGQEDGEAIGYALRRRAGVLLPIVLISGAAPHRSALTGTVLQKPFGSAELLAAIAEVLG